MANDSQKTKTMSIAVIAIVAALALLGIVIVLAVVTVPLQQAEAGCEKGRAGSLAFNQSKGKCLDRGAI
jgi:hypothetical protein